MLKPNRLSLSIATCIVLAAVVALCAGVPLGAAPQEKQEKKVTQTAGVDNTRMGAYRALAQLSLQSIRKGDNATAAELARILERTWDAAEGGGGAQSLGKTNKDLFGQIDQAMDVFIKPIINYPAKAPDAAAVQAAYNDFLEKLKQAE